MLKNFLIALSFMGLFACGHNVTEKSSSSIEREQPALTVYFPPLLAWLSPQERQKLWTFRDMDESTGYWVIVGHSDKNGSDEFKEQIFENMLAGNAPPAAALRDQI